MAKTTTSITIWLCLSTNCSSKNYKFLSQTSFCHKNKSKEKNGTMPFETLNSKGMGQGCWQLNDKCKNQLSLTSETMDGQRNCCWLGETILIENQIGTEINA